MLKRVAAVLFLVALVFAVSVPVFAQKEARIEGKVVRSNADKSTITVRTRDNDTQKTVYYDANTKWNSQLHGAKDVNVIQASDVKDGDQVICLGTYDDKKEFHATTISKRLSHSPE
jgi:hypothetical protein